MNSSNPFLALIAAARAMEYQDGDPHELNTPELRALNEALIPFKDVNCDTPPTGLPPNLDTAPARTDLTSRECAKVIGSVLGGLCSSPDSSVENVRTCMRLIAGEGSSWTPELNPIMRVLMAVVVGLHQMASPQAVLDASQWWATREDAWESVKRHLQALRDGATEHRRDPVQ